jgi:FtsP/CotA-like multicopper oxidase with cupredoxin domain
MKLLAYLVTLIAALGVLFVLFKPSPSTGPTAALNTASAASPASPNAPGLGEAQPVGAAKAPATAQREAQPSGVKTFALIVRGGRLASGSSVIQVREGDRVRLELTTDTSDELHVHGYDLHLKTRSGELVSLNFVAKRTGRFALELHRAELELGALEVYPR